ncbi:MAG: nuclear transport factor 2 family protein [Candidatus Kaiserbacteria bacterium]|nr:nuclear transport factor 2 family protein [Candidatus Kaiserbacteria bacterium]
MIAKAVENLRRAMVEANQLILEKLTAEELSYGHTSGLVENKREFVDAIVGSNRRDVFKMIGLSDQIIRKAGDTAIVRHRFKAEVIVNGIPMHPDIRVIQIWQQKQGEWKLLARQAFRV